MALLEARPYRPFKSSEEYLEAMKEDLAEWLMTMYPELCINAENFMERLDTGVSLCKHANNVRKAAEEYLARRQARNKSMTRSMTSGAAGPILAMGNIHYLPGAKSGTFFARDNVSNFITWCRKSLKIIECLLFETDDLIMRKNEKHVILCLLEVARRGAKFGMLAPMLVQMERQIDREIAADNKANGIGCGTQTDNSGNMSSQTDAAVGTDSIGTETDIFDDSDSENEDDEDDGPMLMYGPQPQIITNDLKSLDEMVRDLVEKCTCPSQFPMVRVSEGKYRIGDTKVLIFVRILRSHVMVRVGGGWDTLSHYLDKHDPCRCKAQHRSAMSARLIPRNSNNAANGIELHKAQVIFERSPPAARKVVSSNISSPSPMAAAANTLAIGNNYGSKTRSRSPTPQQKYLQHIAAAANDAAASQSQMVNSNLNTAAAISYNGSNNCSTSPNLARRSMSPSPRRLIDMRKKQTSLDSYSTGPKSLPLANTLEHHQDQYDSMQTPTGSQEAGNGVVAPNAADVQANNSNKFENISDNGSEISDEGYRSLGVIQSNAQKRESLHSQASAEDAESNARLDQTSSDSPTSPTDEGVNLQASNQNKSSSPSSIELATIEIDYTDNSHVASCMPDYLDMGPQSLPAVLLPPMASAFEENGVFITDDEITVDISQTTGLRKTGYANRVYDETLGLKSKIPSAACKVANATAVNTAAGRRRSIDNSTCSGSLQDLHSRTGLPVFNRKKPVYRSVRQPNSLIAENRKLTNSSTAAATVRDVTNTWSGGRSLQNVSPKKRPTMNADTFSPPAAFERNAKARSSQILYDSNGRRIKGCTASLTTSPVKSHATSPLAQQLLEAASSAKNDAQILEKMKTLLSRYASGNQQQQQATVAACKTAVAGKKPSNMYDDFTSAWVHSNGNLERSSSCSPPAKARSKRSSAASSTESTHSRDMSVIVSPRRERGLSKIPGPVRQHTELY